MTTKVQRIKRLTTKCDALLSKLIRQRDGRCLLCGNTEGLAAHHWILTKGHSFRFRFDPRNLVTLCYACHIHKVHTQSDKKTMDMLTNKVLDAGICTKQDIEEIENSTNETVKDKETFLTVIYDKLREESNVNTNAEQW